MKSEDSDARDPERGALGNRSMSAGSGACVVFTLSRTESGISVSIKRGEDLPLIGHL